LSTTRRPPFAADRGAGRLDFRRAAHRAVIARIATEGDLASGWTIDTAADLFYAVTMPTPWRELTGTCGWSPKQYAQRIS
jgi:hypothetical protein